MEKGISCVIIVQFHSLSGVEYIEQQNGENILQNMWKRTVMNSSQHVFIHLLCVCHKVNSCFEWQGTYSEGSFDHLSFSNFEKVGDPSLCTG